MLGIGKQFPKFQLKGVVSTDLKTAFVDINNDTYKGKWLVFFSYPKDLRLYARPRSRVLTSSMASSKTAMRNS